MLMTLQVCCDATPHLSVANNIYDEREKKMSEKAALNLILARTRRWKRNFPRRKLKSIIKSINSSDDRGAATEAWYLERLHWMAECRQVAFRASCCCVVALKDSSVRIYENIVCQLILKFFFILFISNNYNIYNTHTHTARERDLYCVPDDVNSGSD